MEILGLRISMDPQLSASRSACETAQFATMDVLLANHFAGLSTRGKVLAEYIWLGGSGSDLRSATKVLTSKPSCPADVPLWSYDGSATGQEDGPCSVVYLKARSIHPDPLRCAAAIVGDEADDPCHACSMPELGQMLFVISSFDIFHDACISMEKLWRIAP
jgi:hypothetical protein